MKITKQQLKNIIEEELKETLQASDVLGDLEDYDAPLSDSDIKMNELSNEFLSIIMGNQKGEEHLSMLANVIVSNENNPQARDLQQDVMDLLNKTAIQLGAELDSLISAHGVKDVEFELGRD